MLYKKWVCVGKLSVRPGPPSATPHPHEAPSLMATHPQRKDTITSDIDEKYGIDQIERQPQGLQNVVIDEKVADAGEFVMED